MCFNAYDILYFEITYSVLLFKFNNLKVHLDASPKTTNTIGFIVVFLAGSGFFRTNQKELAVSVEFYGLNYKV